MRVPWEPSSCAACRRLRSKFRSRTGISAATRFGSMGIGGKGRSRAWPPSRGVTSKSPMHAGVASSLDPHARVARRARQRRRVYQSGKGRATNRGGPGGRRAHRWPVGSARDLPRPAPRQRPGPASRLVLLGDPPSFDEDDSDPHCCVKPLDAVALPSLAATAACRTRHGPPASCSAPMVSRLRCLKTVRPGMPPWPPPLPRAPRQSRLRSRTSAVSRRAPRTSREAAACRMRCPPRPRLGAWRIGFDSPLPPVDRAAWRIRAHAGASPAATPPYSRIAQLRIGTWASPSTSYGCRARTGFPPAVWSPSLSGWLPTTPPQGGSNMAATIAPAPKRHQRNLVSTLAATARKADLAPRHYRIAPPRDMPRKATSAASGRRYGSDGALRLSPTDRRTPPRRGSSSRWRESPRCRGSLGSPSTGCVDRPRRPSAAPASARPGPSARTATIQPRAAGSQESMYAKSPAAASGASASSPTRSMNISGPNTATACCPVSGFASTRQGGTSGSCRRASRGGAAASLLSVCG